MSKDSTLIKHNDVKRLIMETAKEMVELGKTGRPFMFLSFTGIQMHGGDQPIEKQVRDFAVMTQLLINEVNKFCLANLGKDYNEIVQEEFLRRENMVPDQEIPDNSKVVAQAKKESSKYDLKK